MTSEPKPKYNPQKHHRRSIRLKGFDYSQSGAYFVTIVTYQRECLFGEIVNGKTKLNGFGIVADECWRAIPEHFNHVELGAYVIMPNHVHGIILINDLYPIGARQASPLWDQSKPHGPKSGSLGAIVGSFKSAVSKHINRELTLPTSGNATIKNTLCVTKMILNASHLTSNPII